MGLTLQLCFFLVMALTCLAEKTIWNDQADILLEYFSIGYRASNSTDIPIMDIKNQTMSVTGLRLGDISTIKRLSDVILETTPNGDTRISGVFGLEKFELKITNARINNYTGPAIMTSKNNSADIAYTVKNPDKAHSCRTKWERFNLGEFSEIKIKTPESNRKEQRNITADFNCRVLPALNDYFKSPAFLAVLSKSFDFCTYKRYLFPL